MGRPKYADARVEKAVQFPETLAARIELHLWSELEQRVPYGKFSEFVITACQEKLASIYKQENVQTAQAVKGASE